MKIKDTCRLAHSYCDGVKDGATFAIKLLDDHPTDVSLVKEALQRCAERQTASMAEMEEIEDTKKGSCI